MTTSTFVRHAAFAALALAIAGTAVVPTAEAAPIRPVAATSTLSGAAGEGPIVQIHDRRGHGHGWGHHRRHHHKHWKKHRRHYDSHHYYYDDRPVIVERHRYYRPSYDYYYPNPFDSLFGALVFNFRFDDDGHSHRRHHGHRRHRD